MKQRTLRQPVEFGGYGVASGRRSFVRILPSESGGIRFRRVDDPESAAGFAIGAQNAADVDFGLAFLPPNPKGLAVGGAENLMGAFAALGIDNAKVEVEGEEIPILDGSAMPLAFLLLEAGIKDLAQDKQVLEMIQPLTLRERAGAGETSDSVFGPSGAGAGADAAADALASLEPCNGFELDVEIDFPHPAIDKDFRRVEIDFSQAAYLDELACARRYGFSEPEALARLRGLGRGACCDCAVVMDAERVRNREGLRRFDECVRKEAANAVADLFAQGVQIKGRYVGRNASHGLNLKLLRAVLADPACARLIPAKSVEKGQEIFFAPPE